MLRIDVERVECPSCAWEDSLEVTVDWVVDDEDPERLNEELDSVAFAMVLDSVAFTVELDSVARAAELEETELDEVECPSSTLLVDCALTEWPV